ncbi:hypothetical protein N7528_009185 [Penicillium herquei]|nr:hypothetical protein N7528_009185 [Penicillium herquei]
MPQTRNLSALAYRKRPFEEVAAEDEDRAISTSSGNQGEHQPTIPTATIPTATTPSKRKEIKAKPTFLVGIDFGTTMTSVSYYKFKLGRRPVNGVSKQAIKSIVSWPGAASSQNKGEVPTESLYMDGQYYWGYGVQRKAQDVLYDADVDSANKPIRFAKLFLEDSLSNGGHSPLTAATKAAPYADLHQTLKALGKDIRDVIRDYLVEIFRHTMAQLASSEGFKNTSKVELALSVPAGWPLKASWALQDILKQAVETVGFGQGFDLFLVNEPEAASAFVLDMLVSQKTITTGETFLVCDAGGGTVDVTTYTIDSRSPFRFSESVPPNGANCGSIYVNQCMERYFRDLLSNNEALERKGISVEEQIQHTLLPRFENGLKRIFDCSKSMPDNYESFIIPGIEPDKSKGFEKNRVKIPL